MKTAQRAYSLLLTLYPRRYREAFGAQMLQTFLDHYEDVKQSERRVGLRFWFATVMDEVGNIARQQGASVAEGEGASVSELVVAAVFLVPLYAVFWAALVKVTLALPHPHVSGLGVLIALPALVLVPGVLSAWASRVLAGAVVSVLPKRGVGSA